MEFNITINAPREKVWNTLWDDASYRAWTSAFAPGSCAITDWQKGSKVQFTDGKGSGMYYLIEEKVPYEYMLFKHLGIIKDGVEDPADAESAEWSGATEDYTLRDVNGQTELIVTMQTDKISKGMLDYFTKTWPKALAKLKDLAEGNH